MSFFAPAPPKGVKRPSKVFINYDQEKSEFVIQTPYELRHMTDNFVEKKWRKKDKAWIVPANWRAREPLMELINEATWSKLALHEANNLPLEANVPIKTGYPEDHPFICPPFKHQIDAYNIGFHRDSLALFFEQGLGKTKTTIDLIDMWRLADQIATHVIVCPLSIALVWEKEYAEHCILEYELKVLKKITKKQLSEPEKIWDLEKLSLRVLVIGIESLSSGSAWPTLQKLLPFLGNVALTVDESSKVKNHKAERTKRVVELASGCRKRLILSGTSVTQGLQDLYSQFQVLNPETLALTSFYAFRNRYCVMGGFEDRQVIAYKNVEELMELIRPFALRREKVDCLDLPEKVFQVRSIAMTPTQTKAYKELKKNLYTEIVNDRGQNDVIETSNVLEAYLRLQQITGGFYPASTESQQLNGTDSTEFSDNLMTAKRSPVSHPLPGSNPKIKELKELMDEFAGRKVVIFARFRAEISAIGATLAKTRNVVQFHGGMEGDEKAASVEAFQNGDADVFVASDAAAFGLTLTAASTCIYFSMGFSLETFLQSQDRIHRIGQKNTCTYLVLTCEGTVDEKIAKALTEKKNLADYVNEQLQLDNNEPPF